MIVTVKRSLLSLVPSLFTQGLAFISERSVASHVSWMAYFVFPHKVYVCVFLCVCVFTVRSPIKVMNGSSHLNLIGLRKNSNVGLSESL